MASTGPSQVDVDRLDTWTRYRNGLCTGCVANCCTMPVEVRLPDLVRLQLVDAFEAEHEAPKQIARRLAKAGVVDARLGDINRYAGLFRQTAHRSAEGIKNYRAQDRAFWTAEMHDIQLRKRAWFF